MSIQQFCLRWNNHQPNFISVFTTLLNTESLVDVTLAAEGKHLQAHKVVLSACSVYFQTLFTENPSRHPIVILKDVKYSDLRIMVDFMYYGEVNVSQEQLPQVLETAKMLKIKGLTEMPESTSLTRAQGAVAEFLPPPDAGDGQRHSASPAHSPTTNKRKRNRRPSTGTGGMGGVHEEGIQGGVEVGRGDAVTLSSLPQQRRRTPLDAYHDRTADATQQTEEQHNNMNSDDPLLMATNPPGLTQGHAATCISSPSADLSGSRRPRFLQRQGRVRRESDENPPLRRHASQPLPSTSAHSSGAGSIKSTPMGQPILQKHSSHPPMAQSKVRVIEQSNPGPFRAGGSGGGGEGAVEPERPQRASHTPAMRSGPPLSCNFCWNTVDECGRILRRKTQYHCPECRTNLCIVPCFHEYHDGAEPAAAPASAPAPTPAPAAR